MGEILCPVREKCPSCGSLDYHILKKVDTEDDFVTLICKNCNHFIVVSYPGAIPSIILRAYKRAFPEWKEEESR